MTNHTRLNTGIGGLDNILETGLPAGHLYLVEGDPGTGKTTLALQFLLSGISVGESALYVTLSESAKELHDVAASHGWTLDKVHIFELLPDAEAFGRSGNTPSFILQKSNSATPPKPSSPRSRKSTRNAW